jgi:hypothetical protein
MIRVPRKKAPRGFKRDVADPGRAWLAVHPGVTTGLPPFWSKVRGKLIEAFEHRCAYTAMWLSHDGEIDHFVSIDEDRRQAYRWNNLRYSSGWLNSSKQGLRSGLLLDPCEVEDDWFEIELPSLRLEVTVACPEPVRPRAEFMLARLRLRDGEQVMRSRRAFYEHYLSGRASLEYLDDLAPLIARAIRKAAR